MMRKIIQFGFSRNVALISGAPKYDLYASQIAKTLQSVSTDGTNIVGVISDEQA
jgi:uncharacterized protein (DUF2141 family)